MLEIFDFNVIFRAHTTYTHFIEILKKVENNCIFPITYQLRSIVIFQYRKYISSYL